MFGFGGVTSWVFLGGTLTWLSAIRLDILGGPFGMLEIKPRSALCNIIALPGVLSCQPSNGLCYSKSINCYYAFFSNN